ncbi:hypothetical protein CFR71_03645 [Novacetimonas pomaceti]|uniref:Glycosyltransferase RgtA/B/C/D-like domain-containing protein n=2 Tax=Novacetimonas pomaceti TaxID=2021998 RepID=A0A318QDE1_9PROT|nr:hypothetical protein CFR71_03645 [Novacetimonas pomaceti]
MRQDRSADLRNYHLYDPWAFVTHREGLDLYPADLQTFFNPLGDLPLYWLGTGIFSDHPRIFAAYQGLWYGVLICIVIWFMKGIACNDDKKQGFGLYEIIASVIIGVTGSAAVCQAGLSSNEVPLADLVLVGVGLVILSPQKNTVEETDSSLKWRSLAGGIMTGLAAGIKPTEVTYGPAILAAVLVMSSDRRTRMLSALLCLAGCAMGFFVTYGWWAVHLWHQTGNPVFPMFNEFFHSNWAPASAFTDQRYKPKTILQWIAYPFFWLGHKEKIVTEPAFTDWRFALAMISCLWLVVHLAFSFREKGPLTVDGRRKIAVLAFSIVGYVVWIRLYSILRYAIPIEAMTGFLMISATRDLLLCADHKSIRTPVMITTTALLVFLGLTTRYPGFGHNNFSKKTFDVAAQDVDRDSVVLLMGRNLSYLAPFFRHPENLHFVGMNDMMEASFDYFPGRTARMLLTSGRPIWMVEPGDPGEKDYTGLLRRFLPDMNVEECHDIPTALNRQKHHDGESAVIRLPRLCRVSGGMDR